MGRYRVFFLIAAITAIVAVAFMVIPCSEDCDAASGMDIRVFIENGDGTYSETLVSSANTVKEVISTAADNMDLTIKYDTLGRIVSVGGIEPTGGKSWNIHQWMPLGTHDWDSVGYDSKSNSQLITGTTYCLHMSARENIAGTNVYIKPQFKPVSDAYVYIRFVYNYDLDTEEVRKAFTTDIRQEGFWIKGTGSTIGEVVENAMFSNGFECTFLTETDKNGNDLQFWITSFFGIEGSTNVGGPNDWAYWSQFTYVDDMWDYNQFTLGYYDPGVYKYVACVYIISINGNLDTGGDLPNVEAEPITVLNKFLNVSFMLNGSIIGNTMVEYGNQIGADAIPDVTVPDGMIFSGWGNISKIITEDTLFEATLIPVPTGYTISYYMEDGVTLLYREIVESGGSGTYPGIPEKPSDSVNTYTFKGWSADLNNVTSDTDVIPVFISTPVMYSVKFFDYDGTLLDIKKVGYGASLSDYPEDPCRAMTVDKLYSFRGWSISLRGYSPVDLSNITDSKVAYASYSYTARQYTVDIISGSSPLKTLSIDYGTNIGELNIMGIYDDSFAKLYLDVEMTEGITSYYTVYGDTTLYAEKVPGEYGYMESGGNVFTDTIVVKHDASSAGQLSMRDEKVIICDISQLNDARKASISLESIGSIIDVFGRDAKLEVIMVRGSMTFVAGTIFDRIGAGESAVFYIGDGPTTNIRISSSLKNVNWDRIYTMTLKVGNGTVTELATVGIDLTVTVPFTPDEGNPPLVWSANASTGKLSVMDSTYSEGHLSYKPSTMLYCVVGTQNERVKDEVSGNVCPYGSVEYVADSSDADALTLVSIIIDSEGKTLYLPSTFNGRFLRTISDTAFNGVTGTDSIVIPSTVRNFDWKSLRNSDIMNVYFLGDSPVFTGDKPAGITVYGAEGTNGWDDASEVLLIRTYASGDYSFSYFEIKNEVTLHKYISGKDVDIPGTISVNGYDCPVTRIGDSSFMNSKIKTVRLSSNVAEIQTRAFFGSSLERIIWPTSGSVSTLWDEAFSGCIYLRNTIIPDTVLFIGVETFENCNMFYSIIIPDSVVDIREGAFYNCSNLGEVIIGSGIMHIPDRCFASCSMLDNVILPDDVRSIGVSAFEKCTELSFIDLNKTEGVGTHAFRLCGSLETVILGTELRYVGPGCLSSCAMLKSINVYCPQPEGFEFAFSFSLSWTF